MAEPLANTSLRSVYFIVLLSFFAMRPAMALQVRSLNPSGVLTLDNGRSVSLAGLVIGEESMPVLTTLIAHKDLSFEPEGSLTEAGRQSGYLYVNAFEIDFPFHPQGHPREKRLMVNQLLIELGAARVDTGKVFKYKNDFLKAEEKARLLGAGVWSFEKKTEKKTASTPASV